jgi:uncharacterized MnhB-related membrane protein
MIGPSRVCAFLQFVIDLGLVIHNLEDLPYYILRILTFLSFQLLFQKPLMKCSIHATAVSGMVLSSYVIVA